MLLGKKRKLGKTIEEITLGEKLSLTEKIEDKDLLLFLGLTNDANPLYIQHDYAAQTPHKKPVVPPIMLTGIITSAVSKYLPGPGSYILRHEIEFLKPVYHYETVEFLFEISQINPDEHSVEIAVNATNETKEEVLKGKLHVCPPYPLQCDDGHALDNF
ncbi:MaoC/PaaZ C-terminal domain-containing protein [Bacillus sp. B15-48]|uniref:MaoC/PaaZ C-terminal domain-containing protein n=1 Tax=Bacillus sp. B15-48 TaxID=1548601 RepID=UPI00193F373B|nr:MaoC/PaaZ C-terminal domain-containing protein [Bacillus sp. B15-48]MBM4762529.1 enoyl-CoA hydratase [Bacillus sp. B15-48]